MSVFGDVDPEDAYDASDPPHDRIVVLQRVVTELSHRDDNRRGRRRDDALRLVANLEREGVWSAALANVRADLQSL